jgi:hypothetical protein
MITTQLTTVYLSQVGHYNFLYPNLSQSIVIEPETKLTRLSWSLQEGLTPFLMVSGVTTLVVWIKI